MRKEADRDECEKIQFAMSLLYIRLKGVWFVCGFCFCLFFLTG